MARWEITREGSKTTIKKNHPFWDALVILFGIGLVVSSIEKAPWLIIPTVLILVGAVWARAKVSHRETPGAPKQVSDISAATLSTKLPTASANRSPLSALGIADELAKLADLHDKGVLSDGEFATQKAKLLASS